MDTYALLTSASPIVLVMGIIVGLYYFRFLGKSWRVLWIYLLLSLLFDVVARFVGPLMENNLILWPLYALVELCCFMGLFFPLIKLSKWLWLVYLITIGYIGFEIVYIDVYDVKSFQSYAKIIGPFTIVLSVLYQLFLQLRQERIPTKEQQYLLYGIMSYFALNLLLLLPINLLVNSSSALISSIWHLYLGLTVVFYLFLSFAIWRNGKNQKLLSYGSS